MKYTNYPPGVRESDFCGDDEEVEEHEAPDFEDYYLRIREKRLETSEGKNE